MLTLKEIVVPQSHHQLGHILCKPQRQPLTESGGLPAAILTFWLPTAVVADLLIVSAAERGVRGSIPDWEYIPQGPMSESELTGR